MTDIMTNIILIRIPMHYTHECIREKFMKNKRKKNRMIQNDPGPPKHALELRDYLKYMFSFVISLFTMVWNLKSKKENSGAVRDALPYQIVCSF